MRLRVRVSGMFVLACVLAALLGALAMLQYNWVGQLSKDERDRMRAHLRARAGDFADDFNRELTRAFLWLQIGPELHHDGPPEAPEQRYERWFTAAPHPELIKSIYKLDVTGAGDLTLQKFERALPRLDPATWPTELVPLRERLTAQLREASAADAPQPPRPGNRLVPPLWPDIPALVIPSPHVIHGIGGGRIALQFEPGPSQTYTIAILNDAYMHDQLIPSLVERHLTSEKDGSLHVAVRRCDAAPPKACTTASPKSENDVIFATPDALPAVLERPDVTEPLWDIRFFEINRFVAERPDGAPGSASTSATLQGQVGPGQAAPSQGAPPPPGVVAKNVEPLKRGAPPPINMFYAREDRPHDRERDRERSRLLGDLPTWYVNVQHPAGSLDAAVARARARNLLVSFGVLLLLATSMGLVLLSRARAGRLAAQQMEFVAGVSHELRTPLAVIRSAAENLADGIVNDDKGVRKYGALIAGEGRRLTQMVEQVMTFAGLQAGRPGFDVRPVDVATLIDSALVAVAPFIHDQGAEITRDIQPSLPLILADAPAVSRCLENLITNALKYGGNPVRIHITARASQGMRRPDVQVTVQDNGSGISARDLPHIFEPFYRGADAISKQIHGSGLGLSLVHRIMAELGGRVSVRSEPGQGSAFTLHLPIAPEAVTADEGARLPGEATAAHRG